MKITDRPGGFWRDAAAFRSAITPPVMWRLLLVAGFALLVCGTDWIGHHRAELEVGIAPYEVLSITHNSQGTPSGETRPSIFAMIRFGSTGFHTLRTDSPPWTHIRSGPRGFPPPRSCLTVA